MTKSKIFFWLSICFILGIALSSFLYPREISADFLYFLLVLAIVLICVFWKNWKIVFVAFALAFFISGFFWTEKKLEKVKNLSDDGKLFSGIVRIVNESEIKDNMQNFVAKEDSKNSKMLVKTGFYPEYQYGDELKIECKMQIPKNLDSAFDYQMYLAKDEIFYLCQNPKIEKLNSEKGNKFYAILLKVKNKFSEKINQLIPVPESGLLTGLIIGGSDQLPKKMKDNFSRTGMTHIVAVSGYNVTIIAEYLMILGIFLGLWRRQAFWFAVTGIILFVTITGLSASGVRAGIMGILLIWAMKNGRLANSENAILFSANLMLLLNPLLLRFDVGFQLSFLATLGIIYLYPIADNYLVKKNKVFGLSEILFLTLSAQIFVLPIILVNFNQLSLISPLANLLVLPIIPLTMMLGFLAIVGSFIFYPLGTIFSWIAFLPLKYETIVIKYLAELKFSSIEIIFPAWGVILWYVILLVGMQIIKKKNETQKNNL